MSKTYNNRKHNNEPNDYFFSRMKKFELGYAQNNFKRTVRHFFYLRKSNGKSKYRRPNKKKLYLDYLEKYEINLEVNDYIFESHEKD